MQDFLDSLTYPQLVLVLLGTTTALTVLGLLMGYAGEAVAKRRGRTIFAVPRKRGLFRKELLGTVLFHLFFVPVAAMAVAGGWIRFEGEGWLAIALSLTTPWIAFQVYYYFFHRSLHHRALFFMHRWHHESLVTSPMTGLSMHPLEAAGWMVGMLVPPMVLSALGLLHFGAYAFCMGNFWVGNIAGHANADFFPQRVSRLSAAFLPPVSYHSLHHARFDGHYGFAAAYMDRLLGTEWPDWKELHDRIYDGTPLPSLKVRGSAQKDNASSSSAAGA